ncbi:DNA alkylation repair protein [Cohnella pontilimi]|uniref:DNA alkylation repair protein n=1 Tax=Cohnella pontilimi TaxID=2564100 RepID=A0A4U0FEI2_9BACL|nr:DNA alkylation repair protein [Cohnella pontilimi]TJY43208.1 DNA alkylation repair protein [Cohnella pontilimi]
MSVVQELAEFLQAHGDEEQAVPMAAYMKNHFPFLGLKSPKRVELTRQFWKQQGLPPTEELAQVVRELWALPEREFQYIAVELLQRTAKQSEARDIVLLEELIVTKSWWDTVDALASHLVGGLFLRYPGLIPIYTKKWIRSDNMWLQRTALLFQLGYKERTDNRLLFDLIEVCRGSKEFFIRKAIGWALREYSKTDPEAVVRYVTNTELSPLSVREALKIVNRKQKLTERGLARELESRTMST